MNGCFPAAAHRYGDLSYADAPAAIAWLEAVGFEVVARQDGDAGTVQHAELRLGDAVVMIASFDEHYETPGLHGTSVGRGQYLHTAMVDELYSRAAAGGCLDPAECPQVLDLIMKHGIQTQASLLPTSLNCNARRICQVL